MYKLEGASLTMLRSAERDHLLAMYSVPERELLQSYCDRKDWTICDGKTIPQPPPPPPTTGAVTATKIVAAVKEQALQDVFKPASAIIEEVRMPKK